MEAFRSTRTTVRFGNFELDCRACELRNQGTRVKLQAQPFQLLQVLVDRPGETLTREELREKIWPSDTFVDFDHGLYNAIKRLREALADTAETPQFIETVPRRGYRFIAPLQQELPRFRSLAILPLENLSNDEEQEYFAEGLTEALITMLAKIGELRVVSRTSSMLYKGARKPLRDIARELDVDAVVQGTVLRAGERVRITAQLIDPINETHLWAESYDRHLRDVLDLHAEVAQAIAREIQVKLSPQERAQFSQPRPIDPEAYKAYLKGRYYWNRRSGEGLPEAARCFEEAIATDCTFAAAYAGLADSLAGLSIFGFVSPAEGLGRAKPLAHRALELEPGLAEAHTSAAWVALWHDYDFARAERGFERAIELNPRYATAHGWFAYFLGLMGRREEAYTECVRAIRLDPLSSPIQWTLACLYWMARRYDEAIHQYKKTIEFDPQFALAHSWLGWVYQANLQYDAAIAAAKEGVRLSHGLPSFVASLAHAYAAGGLTEEAQDLLTQLRERSRHQYVSQYLVGRVYAALSRKSDVLSCLEAACQNREPLALLMNVDPCFEDLRSEARFQQLLRALNFLA